MTIQTIKDIIIDVIDGNCSIAEGAKTLGMSVIDFERLMNSWEDAQQAWGRMLRIAIISEIKRGKTNEEIMANLGCSEAEVGRNRRLLGRTLEAIEKVREGQQTPGCGSCIARVYVSELARMMEQE